MPQGAAEHKGGYSPSARWPHGGCVADVPRLALLRKGREGGRLSLDLERKVVEHGLAPRQVQALGWHDREGQGTSPHRERHFSRLSGDLCPRLLHGGSVLRAKGRHQMSYAWKSPLSWQSL